MSTIQINNKPTVNELWAGIGGHFDSLGQIINEFIDNSISNFSANDSLITKTIHVEIVEKATNGDVDITIEDSGTGIKHLDEAFTLGSLSAGESPLNEHGFGLKHALASANPANDSWFICTRTEEDKAIGQYKKIKAPYDIENFTCEIIDDNQWPGSMNYTGTVVHFTVDRSMFKTIARGIKGGVSNFSTIVDILFEDLGFIYSNIIKEAAAQIAVKAVDSNNNTVVNRPVGAVEPNWDEYLTPGQGSETVTFSSGIPTIINYSFGKMNEKPPRVAFDNSTTRKYYKKSMSSSGVEIRVNGRLIKYNLFKEIWDIEKHNSYNYLLVTLNLKSQDRRALPQTRTSKNGFREGDVILDELYEWIRKYLKEPKRDLTLSDHEVDLFSQLKETMHSSLTNAGISHVVETEQYVFKKSSEKKNWVRLDMYLVSNGKTTIYEGKKDYTTSKDVYQLRMYWDGLVYDGISPNEGILVAKDHPDSVKEMIQIVNSMQDANGNNYNLKAKTWDDLGVHF